MHDIEPQRAEVSAPVFIHSLFRAGSTYLFNVFRRSQGGYWCYQEPLHEMAFFVRDRPEELRLFSGDRVRHLRHPEMSASHFEELYQVAGQCLPHLRSESIYAAYFGHGDPGVTYLKALIDAARGRTVIQECRTSGRIGLIKREVGGVHAYLWRNPWDQWWSYRVTDYFPITSQLFIDGAHPPDVVARLRAEIDFEPCDCASLAEQFAWFRARPLPPDQDYQLFYLLWCLALAEGLASADLLVNIDRLSDDQDYRRQTVESFAARGVASIGFDDCATPQARYARDDERFFAPIEDRVHGLLLVAGMSQAEVDRLQQLRRDHQPQVLLVGERDLPQTDLLRDGERARGLVRRGEQDAARLARELLGARRAEEVARSQVAELTAATQQQLRAAEERASHAEAAARAAAEREQVGDAARREAEVARLAAEVAWRSAEALAERNARRADEAEAARRVAETAVEAERARADAEAARARHVEAASAAMAAELAALRSALEGIYAGRSWRMTKPLRDVNLVRKELTGVMKRLARVARRRARRAARLVAHETAARLELIPPVKEALIDAVDAWPAVASRLRQLLADDLSDLPAAPPEGVDPRPRNEPLHVARAKGRRGVRR